jgi:hypothetical protein
LCIVVSPKIYIVLVHLAGMSSMPRMQPSVQLVRWAIVLQLRMHASCAFGQLLDVDVPVRCCSIASSDAKCLANPDPECLLPFLPDMVMLTICLCSACLALQWQPLHTVILVLHTRQRRSRSCCTQSYLSYALYIQQYTIQGDHPIVRKGSGDV